MIMFAALTVGFEDLSTECDKDIQSYAQDIETAIKTYEHYENLLEILAVSLGRLYNVATYSTSDITKEISHENIQKIFKFTGRRPSSFAS